MHWKKFCLTSSSGTLEDFCSAMMALVLSGRTLPRAASVAPENSLVNRTASSMNCPTWGEMAAGSMVRATLPTSPPLTPMAAPTRESHLATRVLSYTTLG